jgi:hypothetical protein
MYKNIFVIMIVSLLSCGSNSNNFNTSENTPSQKAEVISVSVSGNESNYRFNVGLKSPDKGCQQYANWWEVISEDGQLIYRRILGHSHVNEQPFVRSGGKVSMTSNQVVIIRAHMNTSGYGIKAFKGSVSNGFSAFQTPIDFATNLETIAPLPTGCAF